MIFRVFGVVAGFLIFFWCFWPFPSVQSVPGPPGIDFATTDAQNSFLASMSDHFSCFLTMFWDNFWTNSRARILQGLRTGGHPDGNISEKRHFFFQGARVLQGLRTGGHPDGNIFEKRHLFSRGPDKTYFRKWIRRFFITDRPYRD